MLVTTATVGVGHWIHGDPAYPGVLGRLALERVELLAGLSQGLGLVTTASGSANGRPALGLEGLELARGKLENWTGPSRYKGGCHS